MGLSGSIPTISQVQIQVVCVMLLSSGTGDKILPVLLQLVPPRPRPNLPPRLFSYQLVSLPPHLRSTLLEQSTTSSGRGTLPSSHSLCWPPQASYLLQVQVQSW